MPKPNLMRAWLWVTLAGLAVGAGAVAHVRSAPATSPDLTVHEWGTFTSVAGPEGRPVQWRPFGGPSDLPCFVSLLNPTSIKIVPGGSPLSGFHASVRMETPVIYFYTPRDQTVQVSVQFKGGVITEWYPVAFVPAFSPTRMIMDTIGGIQWHDVEIRPKGATDFPVEPRPSHYYAARETDAAPLQVGAQREKFLFYRGLADFPVRISATANDRGAIVLENRGDVIPQVILFENDGRRIGYRIAGRVEQGVTIERPKLEATTIDTLARELEDMLVGEGLYRREAKAMVETWRDSWFEVGTRLMYVVPKAAVDAVLPLTIQPAPADVARVFVGRLELITPAVQSDVERAIRSNHLPTLIKYGRFLEPISQIIVAKFISPEERTQFATAMRFAQAWEASANEQECKR
jgi:hypothetical protein